MRTRERLLLVALAVPLVAAADTLVVKQGDAFKPGAAASWKAAGNTVTFVMAEGVAAADVAQFLSERLALAKVRADGNKVIVDGLPEKTLLEQVSGLSLKGEADPLADLAGLGGGAVAMQAPEGGGSIRASRPSGDASVKPRIIQDHDPEERFEAEVVEVQRGTFPAVKLKLKVRKSAAKGALTKSLRKGKVFDAEVWHTADSAGVRYGAPASQRNLVSYYLAKGDRVRLHAVADDQGNFAVDWIERDGVPLP